MVLTFAWCNFIKPDWHRLSFVLAPRTKPVSAASRVCTNKNKWEPLSVVGCPPVIAAWYRICSWSAGCIMHSSTGTFIQNFMFIFVCPFFCALPQLTIGIAIFHLYVGCWQRPLYAFLPFASCRFAHIWLHTKANLIKWSRGVFF